MRTCGAAFEPQLHSKSRAIGVGHMLVQLDKATELEARQRMPRRSSGLGWLRGSETPSR